MNYKNYYRLCRIPAIQIFLCTPTALTDGRQGIFVKAILEICCWVLSGFAGWYQWQGNGVFVAEQSWQKDIFHDVDVSVARFDVLNDDAWL